VRVKNEGTSYCVLQLCCREPEDAAILKELNAVKRSQKEEAKASAKLYKGSLGPRPKPIPGQSASEAFAEEIAQAKEKGESKAAAGGEVSSRSRSNRKGGSGFVGKLVAAVLGLIQWLLQLLHLAPRAVAVGTAQPVQQ
jgi:hypothetical protein